LGVSDKSAYEWGGLTMGDIMKKKAVQAQLCFENLKEQIGETVTVPVCFNVDETREKLIRSACFSHNPFPGVLKPVLLSLRRKAVRRLYEDEKVLQTGPAAAVLAMDAALAEEIGNIRNREAKESPVVCDVALAGLQVIRLYMMAYEGNREFIKSRYASAIRVDNALNGSFYKYRTKDGRSFSAHVYYESQKRKMMEALSITKDPDRFVFTSLPFDRRATADAIGRWKAQELEERAFENGACGCMLRTRKEWEETETGKAVKAMPLYRLKKETDTPVKNWGSSNSRGPLSGIKVLDLTHIIAGPACTRLLAEMGADVLMIRRGDYLHQEQAMLELDGWAGKNSVQLDFNLPEELARAKDLVREADVVVSSYQSGALDRFGLSDQDIHKLNPNVIYGSLVCFSDTVWKERPGWAPCAEDITGLSIRNGSLDHPVNLNGVPLDYIPGFILTAGILQAIRRQMTEGGSYTVTGSLTRGAMWLHECTDLWEKEMEKIPFEREKEYSTRKIKDFDYEGFRTVYHKVEGTAVGTVYFPAPAVRCRAFDQQEQNMGFQSGCRGWREKEAKKDGGSEK
jgi:crotonobetainyl-CoA:carnitine CoA-transferase CaiB-like acyl-CoA transferase